MADQVAGGTLSSSALTLAAGPARLESPSRESPAQGRSQAAFLRRLLVTGLGTGLSRLLGLVFVLMLAALFVPADYGYIRWAMSVAMLAAIPAAAGPVALARALGAADGAPAEQRRLARLGLLVVAAVTAVCAIGTMIVLRLFDRPVGGVLSVLVGMTLFAACFNVYRGVGSAWRMTALYAGGNALQLAVVLAICGALGVLVPDLVLVVYSFAWLVVLAALELRAPLLRRGASSAAFGASATSSSATWIRSALGDLGRVWVALAVAQAAYTAWMWADIVLVEHYLGAAAAGHYGVARTLVMVLVLVPEAVTLLLLPHSAAEGQRARGLTARLLAMTAAVSAIGLLGLLVVAPVLLGLVADGRYLPAAAALPGLGVGMAIYALYMVLEGHLVGAGHARAHAAAIVVMATVTLGSAALLLPSLGLAGAGVAFVLGALAGLSTLLGIVFGFPRLWRAS